MEQFINLLAKSLETQDCEWSVALVTGAISTYIAVLPASSPAFLPVSTRLVQQIDWEIRWL